MPRRFCLLVYMMRVPLMTLLVLGAALPLAFQTTMFHGVADLEESQVFGAAFLAFLLFSEAITCAFLVLLYGEERADGWQPDATAEQRVSIRSVVALYVVAVICYIVFFASIRSRMLLAPRSPAYDSSFWSPKGFFLVLWPFSWFSSWSSELPSRRTIAPLKSSLCPRFSSLGTASGSTAKSAQLRNVRRTRRRSGQVTRPTAVHSAVFFAQLLGPGYGTPRTNDQPATLHSGHRFAFLLTVGFFVCYIWTGRSVFHELLAPGPWSHQLSAVLFYLLLLVMFWCPLLSGLTFFFDRFRLPALLMLGIALYVLALPNSSDHQFETVDQLKPPRLHNSKSVFVSGRDKIIVVAAAGGGIQSAAWASRVLCGLRQQVPQFSEHVAALSGVSGGSVGAMFYLKCLEGEPQDISAAKAASESSLEAIAWGLTHPDLRRAFLAGLLPSWSGADRGWALEKALLKNAQFRSNDRLLTGDNSQNNWPIILLNSTNAETGDPMVFTNSDFPPGSTKNHQLNSFHARYPGRDVRLETAVRMSAAFPYVSPVARPDQTVKAEHYADGGYFDNSGLFTLSEWLKEATVEQIKQPAAPVHSQPRILFLQIDAFPDSNPSQQGETQKWYYQLYAPVLAMLNVRSEGQIVRDITSGEDLQELLNGRGYATAWAKMRYIPDTNKELCPQQPPLSWHLTSLEKRCIENAWSNVSGSAQGEVQAFLTQGEGYFPEAGCTGKDKQIEKEKQKGPIYVRRCAAK